MMFRYLHLAGVLHIAKSLLSVLQKGAGVYECS